MRERGGVRFWGISRVVPYCKYLVTAHYRLASCGDLLCVVELCHIYCARYRFSVGPNRVTVVGGSRRGTVGPYHGTGPHRTSDPVSVTRKRSEHSMLPRKIPVWDSVENFNTAYGEFGHGYSAIFGGVPDGDFVLQQRQICSFSLGNGQRSQLTDNKKNFNP